MRGRGRTARIGADRGGADQDERSGRADRGGAGRGEAGRLRQVVEQIAADDAIGPEPEDLVDDAVGVEIGAEDQVYAVVDQAGVELAIAVGVEDEWRRFEVRHVAGLMHGPPPVAR